MQPYWGNPGSLWCVPGLTWRDVLISVQKERRFNTFEQPDKLQLNLKKTLISGCSNRWTACLSHTTYNISPICLHWLCPNNSTILIYLYTREGGEILVVVTLVTHNFILIKNECWSTENSHIGHPVSIESYNSRCKLLLLLEPHRLLFYFMSTTLLWFIFIMPLITNIIA